MQPSRVKVLRIRIRMPSKNGLHGGARLKTNLAERLLLQAEYLRFGLKFDPIDWRVLFRVVEYLPGTHSQATIAHDLRAGAVQP